MVRRSGRYALAEDGAGATDEDVMQRAMQGKSERNLDTTGTEQPVNLFTSFSDSCISSNLSSLGVSMGSKSYEILVWANVLRRMEHDRLTVVPKVSTGLETPILDEDEGDDILDGQLLSALVGNVVHCMI
jgi:hypothetical protein